MRACLYCYYWYHPVETIRTIDEHSIGECRALPPTAPTGCDPTVPGSYEAIWPATRAIGWCGSFLSRETIGESAADPST